MIPLQKLHSWSYSHTEICARWDAGACVAQSLLCHPGSLLMCPNQLRQLGPLRRRQRPPSQGLFVQTGM